MLFTITLKVSAYNCYAQIGKYAYLHQNLYSKMADGYGLLMG